MRRDSQPAGMVNKPLVALPGAEIVTIFANKTDVPALACVQQLSGQFPAERVIAADAVATGKFSMTVDKRNGNFSRKILLSQLQRRRAGGDNDASDVIAEKMF